MDGTGIPMRKSETEVRAGKQEDGSAKTREVKLAPSGVPRGATRTASRSATGAQSRTQPRARTLAVDTASHRVFLSAAQFGDKPAPSVADPKPRAPTLPGTFVVLVVGK
jgi:hypothetical protein